MTTTLLKQGSPDPLIRASSDKAFLPNLLWSDCGTFLQTGHSQKRAGLSSQRMVGWVPPNRSLPHGLASPRSGKPNPPEVSPRVTSPHFQPAESSRRSTSASRGTSRRGLRRSLKKRTAPVSGRAPGFFFFGWGHCFGSFRGLKSDTGMAPLNHANGGEVMGPVDACPVPDGSIRRGSGPGKADRCWMSRVEQPPGRFWVTRAPGEHRAPPPFSSSFFLLGILLFFFASLNKRDTSTTRVGPPTSHVSIPKPPLPDVGSSESDSPRLTFGFRLQPRHFWGARKLGSAHLTQIPNLGLGTGRPRA